MLQNKQKLIECPYHLMSVEKLLRRTLILDDMHVFETRKQAEEREKEYTDTHDRKLAQLIPRPPALQTTMVYNLSKKQLSESHASLLAKGLDSTLVPRVVPKKYHN